MQVNLWKRSQIFTNSLSNVCVFYTFVGVSTVFWGDEKNSLVLATIGTGFSKMDSWPCDGRVIVSAMASHSL